MKSDAIIEYLETINKMQKEIKDIIDSYMKFLSEKKKILGELPLLGQELIHDYDELAVFINEDVYNKLFENQNIEFHYYLLKKVREIKKTIMGDGVGTDNYLAQMDTVGGTTLSIDPLKMSGSMNITNAVIYNLRFTSLNSMACDVFVTKVLSDAKAKPNGWSNPLDAKVIQYRDKYSSDLKEIASNGWNIVMMYSENPTIVLDEEIYPTDPDPHMGLINKNKDTGELTFIHYTHSKVNIQFFKNETDLNKRMPYEIYRYDTVQYKSLEQ